MSATNVGTIGVGVEADVSKLKSGFKEAVDAGKDFTEQFKGMNNVLRGFQERLGAIGMDTLLNGLKSGASFVTEAVSRLNQMAGGLTDLSARVKVNTTTLQEWDYAASLVGVSGESVANSMAIMSRNIGSGSETAKHALSQVGLSVQQLKAMKPEDQFTVIAARLRDIKDPAEQAAAGAAIMGRGFNQILPMIESDLKATAEQAQRLGFVLSEEVVAAGDALGDSFDTLQRTADGFVNNLVSGIVTSQAMHDTVNGLTEILGELSGIVSDNSESFQVLVEAGLFVFLEALAGAGFLVTSFISQAKMIVDALFAVTNAFNTAAVATLRFGAALAEKAGQAEVAAKLNGIANTLDAGNAKMQGFGDRVSAALANASATAATMTTKVHALAQSLGTGKVKLDDVAKGGSGVARSFKEADKETEALAKRLKEIGDTFSGAKAQQEMNELALGIEMMGGLSGVADQQLMNLTSRVDQLVAAGAELPPIFESIATAEDTFTKDQLAQIATDALKGEKALHGLYAVVDKGSGLWTRYGDVVEQEMENARGEVEDLSMTFEEALAIGQSALAGLAEGLDALGVSSDSIGVKVVDLAQTSAAFAEAWASGNIAGILSNGMKMAGQIKGIFDKPEFKRIAEDVGRRFGTAISDGLAQAIEDTEKTKGVGRHMAELLHLGDIMGESDLDPREFQDQIGDLLNAVALGAVPAADGIAELGDAFSRVAEAAMNAGSVGDAAMVGIIQRARELGLEIPEIAAHVREQLATATAGVGAMIARFGEDSGEGGEFITGIQINTEQQARDQGVIFSAVFWASVRENGIVAAADSMRDMIQPLYEAISMAGTTALSDEILAPILRIMDLTDQGGLFRGAAEGAEGLRGALEGLANAGYLTEQSFGAIQGQAQAAFDQMVAGGATSQEALLAMAPLLQSLVSASQNYGIELDANTAALVRQAEEAGVAFREDPIERVATAVEALARHFGALPPLVDQFGSALDELGNRSVTIPVRYDIQGGGGEGGNTGIAGGRPQPPQPDFYSASGYEGILRSDAIFKAHRGERVSIQPVQGAGPTMVNGGGGATQAPPSMVFAPQITVNGAGNEEEIRRAVVEAITNNLDAMRTEIREVFR